MDDHYPSYPLDKESYELVEKMGKGVSSIVHKAICIPLRSFVAIKVIDLQKSNADLEDLRREARYSCLLNHPTLLRPHCFFAPADETSIWVVMPFMSGGSLHSIIASSSDGLPEPYIAALLKEILATLAHIHGELHFHGCIKAGNILVDSTDGVKLADSSMSSLMSGTWYWMAPEVIPPSHTGYGDKTDIWSFGVTALELALGRPPLSHPDHQPPSMSKFTQSFKHMVGVCLYLDPSKRPTAKTLLKHPFFQNIVIRPLILIKKVQVEVAVEQNYNDGGEIPIRGWKLNEERFELDAIYNDDDINMDMVNVPINGDLQSCDNFRALVLKVMEYSVEILEYQKQKVQEFINVKLMGNINMTAEEMMIETLEILNLEMDHKIKEFELEMEVERLQLQLHRSG